MTCMQEILIHLALALETIADEIESTDPLLRAHIQSVLRHVHSHGSPPELEACNYEEAETNLQNNK